MFLHLVLISAYSFAPSYGVRRWTPSFVRSGWGWKTVDPSVVDAMNEGRRRRQLERMHYERELFGVGRATIAEMEGMRPAGSADDEDSRRIYRENIKSQLAERQALRRAGVPFQRTAGDPEYDVRDEHEMPAGCDKLQNGECIKLRGRSAVDGQEVWTDGFREIYSYEQNKNAKTTVVSPATVIYGIHHHGLRVNPDIIDDEYTPDDRFNHRYGRKHSSHPRSE